MKNRRNWMLALLIALALVTSVFAFAENVPGDTAVEIDGDAAGQQPVEGLVIDGGDDSGAKPEIENDPVSDGGTDLDGLTDLSLGDLVSGAPEAVVVYRFMLDGEEYAAQTAKEGEEILRPEDPPTPEGTTFEGWYLEDETPLFADADGDGVVDAVIAHVDAESAEITVYARFAEEEGTGNREQGTGMAGDADADKPVADEPVVDKPVADEPVADQPVADKPVADEPVADEPVSDQPTADKPVADEPVADEPVTDKPVADEPVVDQPVADQPVADEPVADEPVADQPVTDKPVADEPVADQPVTDKPVADEPVADEPVADEPVADEPVADEPVADQPVADQPVADEPVVDEPVADEPVADEPVADQPVADQPVADQPVADEPVADQPAADEPVADEPVADQPAEDAAAALPVGNALTYTGEAQALVSADGEWLYSLDGESFSSELPTAVNAGEYTVFFKPAGDPDAEAQTLAVTVAKADVTFIPPEAAAPEE